MDGKYKAEKVFCQRRLSVSMIFQFGNICNANLYFLLIQSHQFKIEKSTQAGTNVIAAFASRKPEDLNKLRKIIKRCIKRGGVGKDKKKQRIILPKTMVASSGRVSSQNATTTPQVTKGRFITTMYDFDVDDGKSKLQSYF